MAVTGDNEIEIHVRCVLLYDFKAGLRACESHHRIKEAFGEIIGESAHGFVPCGDGFANSKKETLS